MSQRARDMQKAADRARREGTAAVECWCGTWHSPGTNHKQNDTGPEPKGVGAQGCNG